MNTNKQQFTPVSQALQAYMGQTMISFGNIFRPTQQVQLAPQPTGVPGGLAPVGNIQQGVQQHLQQQAPQGPGSTMDIKNPAADPNIDPKTGKPKENSPLDAFAKMWETDPNAKPPVDPWSQPILPTNPADVAKAVSQANMMQGIDPALIQKVNAGNDPAALMELINKVSQNTLLMSTQLVTASVEKAGTTVRDRLNQNMDARFQQYLDKVTPVDNPILNHPGAQNLLQMARQQLRMKNPTASAAEINQQATTYLQEFGNAMHGNANPPPKDPVDAQGNKEQDWSSFLNS